MKATHTANVPVTGVRVKAPFLELEIVAEEGRTVPVAEVSGPEAVLKTIAVTQTGGVWSLAWPEGSGGGGSATVYQSHGVQVNNFSRGGFSSTMNIGAAGRVVVNGVDVTDFVNGAAPGASEPLAATIRVPSGFSVDADVKAGSIRTTGTLKEVRARSRSADVDFGGPVGNIDVSTASGDVTANYAGLFRAVTASGDVRIGSAMAAVAVSAASGDVEVHAIDNISVSASTASGDIRVTCAPGLRPLVSANSASGRVRTP